MFEPLTEGAELEMLVYPDTGKVQIEDLQKLAETGEPAVMLLISVRNWDDPTVPGMWGITRVISGSGPTTAFLGGCSDMVNADFQALAKELGRPADRQLLLDFAGETLRTSRQDVYNPGPIGTALLDMRGMHPLPTTQPPGPIEDGGTIGTTP